MSERRKYIAELTGVTAKDMPVSALRDLCELIAEGASQAARLAVEGRSVARGNAPAWLAHAADVRVGDYREGSLMLVVGAPSVETTLNEVVAQQELFARTKDRDATAVDFLIEAMRDAVSGNADSEMLDSGVLDVLRKSRPLFGGARTDRKLYFGRDDRDSRVILDASSFEKIEELAELIPAARVERVMGTLDTLTVSTRAFVLKVKDAENLRGIAAPGHLEVMKALLGQEVVVEGLVSYRPSGDAFRIESDYVAAASQQDSLWQKRPHVQPQRRAGRHAPAGPDLALVIGRWPGDETDEELLAAMQEMA